MMLNSSASASSDGVVLAVDDEAGGLEEHDGVKDLVALADNSVHDLDDLACDAADVLEKPDGADHPEDIGAQKARVTGADKEALFAEASGEQGRRPQGLRSPTAPTREEYEPHVLTHSLP